MIDYTTFVPVVGYPIAQKQMLDDYHRGDISFQEAAIISAANSAIYAGTIILAAQSNYLAAKQFQRMGQGTIVLANITRTAAPALAVVTAGVVLNESTRKRIGSRHFTTPFTSGFGTVV